MRKLILIALLAAATAFSQTGDSLRGVRFADVDGTLENAGRQPAMKFMNPLLGRKDHPRI